MNDDRTTLQELDERSREIFKAIVEGYLKTGAPVGSRNVSRALPMSLSPASVRNVMSDLEELGLIHAPHVSAGRQPTHHGLRLFVDSVMEIGNLSDEERAEIDKRVGQFAHDSDIEEMLADASELISGLSNCAGVVLTQKRIDRLKHIDFVVLEPGRALVVLVGSDGMVENRIIDLPQGLPPSALVEAANYLNTHVTGKTLAEARKILDEQLNQHSQQLDELTAEMVKTGLAQWSRGNNGDKSLIVRGRSHLINELHKADDLERIQQLFDDLERKRDLVQLLELADDADGVRIFIGAENKLFSLSGSSMIVAPFRDENRKAIGVLGVIGPTRLNYARIIPIVDYTARLMGRLLPG